ncbi:ornithine cyclodeaminase family protein [Stappia sp. GBMRC 2046]|uniref:Ornithine cyclodeaminase family protein n=1 Tax=Stappia sediminis TaxID=2692190 RepID=A0A7X3LSM5_9HYPH|nr:ornithine cyclodeaminase family protein [Stappia sediminis]MXN64346.1 ornithine cyclodeaminase family protein [Stappia sediminis]
MLHLDERATREALEWRPLVEALREMFKTGCEMPVRHHHDFKVPGEADGTLLLMPAWLPGKYIGVKMATVVPGNGARGLQAVMANYCLSSGMTGEMLAMIDGGELTARRTAATSALAADYLARKDARHLLVVGTGRIARNLVPAHAAVRKIEYVRVWGRDPGKALAFAEEIAREEGIACAPVSDLDEAVSQADIVTAATLSDVPLIRGEALREGTHVDLVGAFKPSMRESDDEAVRRSSVFVDTRAGALKEAGDIIQAIEAGAIDAEAVKGDLFDLARGGQPGRSNDSEITLFKMTGAALEDLAAGILAYEASASG